MMKRKWLFAILVLLIFSSSASNELKKDQEVQVKTKAYHFIEDIYSNYQIKDSIFDFKGPAADEIFCYELLQLIRLDEKLAQGEVGYLEVDPLCFCQDDEGLTVKSIRIQKISCDTYAFVNLMISKQQVNVIYKLNDVKGMSCIADIKTEIMPSLYKFLFRNLIEDVMTSDFLGKVRKRP